MKYTFLIFFLAIFSLNAQNKGVQPVGGASHKACHGFVGQHEARYFTCIREIDALINKYQTYYTVDEKKRSIVVCNKLSSSEKIILINSSKELDSVIYLFSSCSPGDLDYLPVKETYYPLLREMRHKFHTHVLQPLAISTLDRYDHLRKIVTPTLLVFAGMGIIIVLQKMGLFPRCSMKTLITYGAIIAAAGIVYNYRRELASWFNDIELLQLLDKEKNNQGIDFAILARTHGNGDTEYHEKTAAELEGFPHGSEKKTKLMAIAREVAQALKRVKVLGEVE